MQDYSCAGLALAIVVFSICARAGVEEIGEKGVGTGIGMDPAHGLGNLRGAPLDLVQSRAVGTCHGRRLESKGDRDRIICEGGSWEIQARST